MPKILIVDDEPDMRILLEQTLEGFEDKGVILLTADNGKKAIECIKAEKPELVFLDVMMPEINGFEICNTVKNEYGMKDVYIVILTAKGQEIDKQQGQDVGVDVYMTKPFDLDEIVEKTIEVLGIKP
jgi:DNA-binding response OmpR family regulator